MAENTGNQDSRILIGLQIDPKDESRLYNQIARISSRVPAVKLRFQNQGVLGTMSKDAGEFERSLAAASSRVLSFGATAGILFGLSRAFNSVVKSTIDVEKSLTDINVVLGLSSSKLQGFSKDLFDIANKTGQAFNVAAKAALEFSRQGLSVEQTLKRTQDALILTRLSGLDAAKSVETITAALNGFNDATLTSTILINKLATVDASFAVSTADLAEAFTRVGSTAADTGVSLNSLIAIVTSAQQSTARGGAVIGNSLKTIFQRISRTDTLNTLQQFNVEVKDLQGNLLPADRILINLAKSFKGASVEQQNFITQLAAGVFQSNQFRAILNDLAKENSVYSRALSTSASATDQATQRNLELNKTLAASLNEIQNRFTELGSSLGSLTIKSPVEAFAKAFKQIEGFFQSDNIGARAGVELGTGILKGLGEYISGPGAATAVVLAGKLFVNFATFSAQAFGRILENSSKEFQVRDAINKLLIQNQGLSDKIRAGGLSQLQIQESILAALRGQSIEYARQGQIVSATKVLASAGQIKLKGDNFVLGKTQTKAVGHVPEIQEKMGAYAGGYTPGAVKEMNVPSLGKVVYNTAETVKKFPGMSQPAIIPPLNSKAGINYKKDFVKSHGFDPYKSEGLVPNFASAFHGKKIAIDRSFQTGASHAIRKAMESKRLSEADLNEIAEFFRNPVIDDSRIIASVPSSKGIPGEQEINYLLPSKSGTGIQMVLAMHPDKLDQTRIVSIKNRTGMASEGLVPNFANPENIRKSIGNKFEEFEIQNPFANRGVVPNYASYKPIPLSSKKIASNLESKYGQGEYFGEFYNRFSDRASQLPGNEGALIKRIYASQSFNTNDAYAIGSIADLVKGLRGGRNVRSERRLLKTLGGTLDQRHALFDKIVSNPNAEIGSKPYSKTRQFNQALDLDPNALPVDKNFLYAATGARNKEELAAMLGNGTSVGKDLFEQLHGITSGLAQKTGVTVPFYQSAVFAGRRKSLPGKRGDTVFDPFDRAFDRLSLRSGGLVPNYAILGKQLSNYGYRNYLVRTDYDREDGGSRRYVGEETFGEEARRLRSYPLRKEDTDFARKQNISEYLKFRKMRDTFIPNPEIPLEMREKYLESRHFINEQGKTDKIKSWFLGFKKLKNIDEKQLAILKDQSVGSFGLRRWDVSGKSKDDTAFLYETHPEFNDYFNEALFGIRRNGKGDSPEIRRREANQVAKSLKTLIKYSGYRDYEASSPEAIKDLLLKQRQSSKYSRQATDIFLDKLDGGAITKIFGQPEYYSVLGQGAAKVGLGELKIKDVFGELATSNKEADSMLKYARSKNHYLSHDGGASIAKEFLLKDSPFFGKRHGIADSRGVIDFLVRNKENEQIKKVRTAFGPAGEQRQFTYGDLVEHIRDEDLTNGAKTSVPKVFESVNKRLEEKIKAEIAKRNSPFPPIPHLSKDTPKVRRLMNEQDLISEGERLGHCVGGYGPACSILDEKTKLPRSVIVSTGTATAELNPLLFPSRAKTKWNKTRGQALEAFREYRNPNSSWNYGMEGKSENEISGIKRQTRIELIKDYLSQRQARKIKQISAYQIRGAGNSTPKPEDIEAIREYVRVNGLSPNFSSGLIPNYSALSSALQRENKAGIPFSQIRVGNSPALKSPLNPAGLGVYNTKDEPRGLNQGIQRAVSMGLNPKTHGVPNFATIASNPTTRVESEIQRLAQENKNLQKQLKAILAQPVSIGQNIQETLTRRQIATTQSELSGARQRQLSTVQSRSKAGVFYENVKSSFKDPENRGPGDYLLRPQKSAELQTEIDKLKVGIKIGVLNQEKLNSSIDNLAKTFNLTDTTTKKIKTNLGASLANFERLNPQFVKNQSFFAPGQSNPAQSGFQQISREERIRQNFFKFDDGEENQTLLNSKRAAARKAGRLGQFNPEDPLIMAREERLKTSAKNKAAKIEAINDRATSDSLQGLKTSASRFGGIGSYFGQGKRDFKLLQQDNPDAARDIRSSLQNKAFLASIVGPILGGVASQTAVGLLGDNTTGRGVGAVSSGLGNAAGFGATAFALGGGPIGAGIGFAGAFLSELPSIINSFSDTLPDLKKRFGELQDSTQKTSASLAEYIDTSEKLTDVFTGKITGLTNGEIKQLQSGQAGALRGIANSEDRKRISSLIESGNVVGAREQAGLINQRNAQSLNAVGLAASVATLLPKAEKRAPLSGFGGFLSRISPKGSLAREGFEAEERRRLTDPKRLKQLENIFSPIEQGALGLTSVNKETGESKDLFDILLGDKSLTERLKNSPVGQFNEEFTKILTELGGFDIEAIATYGEVFKKIEGDLGKEGTNNLKRILANQGELEKQKKAGEVFVANQQVQAKSAFDLNIALLRLQKEFETLGTTIQINGIKRISELNTSLKTNEIRAGTQNELKLIGRNGPGLSNLLNLNQEQLSISNQANLGKAKLQTDTGENVFSGIAEIRKNVQNKLENDLKVFFKDDRVQIQKRIGELLKQFDSSFKPFIDRLKAGEPVTTSFLDSLNRVAESQLTEAERTSVNFGAGSQERASAESLVPLLRELAGATGKIQDTFKVGRTQINEEEKSSRQIAIEKFNSDEAVIQPIFDNQQKISKLISALEVSGIGRQGFLARQQTIVNPRDAIGLQSQAGLAGATEGILGQAIRERNEIGDLGLTLENFETLLPRLIADTEKLKQNTADTAENQQLYADRSRALIDLQTKYNSEKEKQAALEKLSIQNLEDELRLSQGRLDFINKTNAGRIKGQNFKDITDNLGKDFSELQSFTESDFYDELSKNNTQFALEFKQTFKEGFAEAATGASKFSDALRNIGISLGKNILTKASNLATDQLFGALFGKESNLLGGGAGIFSSVLSSFGTQKAAGGPIKKYAYGGYVNQGSGVKDDVPALLGGGEFVIKKSSTQKLGRGFLDSLNNGDVKKFASGGLNYNFTNEYVGVGDPKRPTSGYANISPLLSDLALTDENNPQNALRLRREQYFKDLNEYNFGNAITLKEFEKQQTSRRTGAYISAGINLAGSLGGGAAKSAKSNYKNYGQLTNPHNASYLTGRANGGLIESYANGGSIFGGNDIRDTIPAYLMGGEFVFNKNAANRIGKSNLDYMNKTGNIPRFQNGGYVGDAISSPNYGGGVDMMSKYFMELISVSAQIRDSLSAGDRNVGAAGPSGGMTITNSITVHITENGASASSNTQASSTNGGKDNQNNQDKQAQGKQFGELVTNIVNSALVRESKAGGLLYNQFVKK